MGEHFFLIIITGVNSTIFPDNAATFMCIRSLCNSLLFFLVVQQPYCILWQDVERKYSISTNYFISAISKGTATVLLVRFHRQKYTANPKHYFPNTNCSDRDIENLAKPLLRIHNTISSTHQLAVERVNYPFLRQ